MHTKRTTDPSFLQAQGTLPVYPRLIISSKSNASDESSATNLELRTVAGGSTESIQSTGVCLPFQVFGTMFPSLDATR